MMKWTTIIALTVTVMTVEVSGELHRVGDKFGWSPNVNYSEWSKHKHFYLHHWLLFVFDKRYYNVLEVNETNYERCNDQVFIRNITRGGRDVFRLEETRPYYFLSGGGYCWAGMKLALLVEQRPSATAPPPAENSSPSLVRRYSHLPSACPMLLVILIVLF